MAKTNKHASMGVAANPLSNTSALGESLKIDPVAKFQAQYWLSRENIDPKGASIATKIAQKDLHTHDNFHEYIFTSILNEVEIFSSIYQGKKFDKHYEEEDYANAMELQKRIEGLLLKYKGCFMSKNLETQKIILTFYKVSADLFEEKVQYGEKIFNIFEIFYHTRELHKLAEQVILENYITCAQNLMNSLVIDIWCDNLRYLPNEDNTPAYKFHTFISVFTLYFLANEDCIDSDVHEEGLRLVRNMNEVYELILDQKLESIVANEENAEFVTSLYHHAEFKTFITEVFAFPKVDQDFDRTGRADKLLHMLKKLVKEF